MLLINISGPNGFNSFNKLVLIFNVKVDGLNCLQLIQFLVVSDVDITRRVHTCFGREPCARVRFVFTQNKNRPTMILSRPLN